MTPFKQLSSEILTNPVLSEVTINFNLETKVIFFKRLDRVTTQEIINIATQYKMLFTISTGFGGNAPFIMVCFRNEFPEGEK